MMMGLSYLKRYMGQNPLRSSVLVGHDVLTGFKVPIGLLNQAMAEKFGEEIGRFLEFDASDPLGLSTILRFKASVQISKPLLRGSFILLDGKKHWVDFHYECLPITCYGCGHIGHFTKSCGFVSVEDGHKHPNQFGPWLRAGERIRHRTSKEDRVDEASKLQESLCKAVESSSPPTNNPMQGITKSLLLITACSEVKKRKVAEQTDGVIEKVASDNISNKKVRVETEEQGNDAQVASTTMSCTGKHQ